MLIGPEILTTAQMRAIESAAMQQGEATGARLMEYAGQAVAGQIRLRWPKAGHAVILCGPGNNGGDGYVVARLLHRAGWRISLLATDRQPGPDAALMRSRWSETGKIHPLGSQVLTALPPGDLYIDAIFGTGLARAPAGPIADVLATLTRLASGRGRPILAIDCPSGLCLDSGLALGEVPPPCATVTVAFDSPKPGHLIGRGPELCGQLVIADIGLRKPREAARAQPDLTALWPAFQIADRRTAPVSHALAKLSKSRGQAHKFSHGHALVLAGPASQGGAARLSARAALRIGAGLVTIAPPTAAMSEHAQPPNALMRRGIDTAEQLASLLGDRRITALCLGPGCGIDRARALLPAALAGDRPLVLDADALTALAQDPELAKALTPRCILTPHAGEFARLCPDLAAKLSQEGASPPYSKLDAARGAARQWGATILLKGPDTVIAAPDGRALIHSAFDLPWLATAGAGDVLAGIITGLLARGFPPLEAASLGCVIHAMAARLHGPGLIADDLPEAIPRVIAPGA